MRTGTPAEAGIQTQATEQATEISWRRGEFERGFADGSNDKGYRPTSLPYVEGYESGKLAAIRRKRQ